MWFRRGLFAALFVAFGAYAAPQGQKFEYRTLERAYASVEGFKQYRFVSAVPVLRRLGGATGPIEMVIRTLEADMVIDVAEDGSLRFPFSESLSSENPQVWTNIPAREEVRFDVQLRAEAPGQKEFDYGLLQLMRDEFRSAYASQGMFARLRAPSISGLVLEYPVGTNAEATIQTPGGPARFRANEQGEIVLPIREDWISAKLPVSTSQTPTRIRLAVASS